MKKIKIIIITIFLNLCFINLAFAETIKFSVGTWEGDVKKGKANGKGILTFDNGLIFEGKMKKNKIHGTGKLTTLEGEVYEGKWRYGKLYNKLDKKTRKVIELGTTGRYFWVRHEVRGTGSLYSKWFPAEEKSGSFVLSAAGKKKMDEALRESQAGSASSGGGAAC